MKTGLFLPLLVIFCFNGQIMAQQVIGQKIIMLDNPSFEQQERGAGIVPAGWMDLGDVAQTPPDIQPGFFGVTFSPQHGKTYLGLCVRENNTWEGVGQKLDHLLQIDNSYVFSVWLNRSNTYQSPVYGSPEIKNFNNPTVLKIWGYNTKTSQDELLAESQAVGHSEWVRYEFVLKPTLADYDELDLMAYYAPGHEKKNGNLLIDNCSAIVKVDK